MDRRTFNRLAGLGVIGAFTGRVESSAQPMPERSNAFRSGQDSPVYDSDRVYPIGSERVVIENSSLCLAFDRHKGALIQFLDKRAAWNLQTQESLGESFVLFAATKERSYSPVLGVRNVLSSVDISPDGQSAILEWSELESEYEGRLPITLRGKITLTHAEASFEMQVENHSACTLTSLSWPILGALNPPVADSPLTLLTPSYGTFARSSLSPVFDGQVGYYGTNYPTQFIEGRYALIAGDRQGIYAGQHGRTVHSDMRGTSGIAPNLVFELRPGYSDSYDSHVPEQPVIGGHPARMVMSEVHFPFLNAGESSVLAPIVLSPYRGDWHSGVDVYKRWRSTWAQRPPMPAWAARANAWQQIEIDSPEGDLRTAYVDLPRRAEQAAKHGISAIQLVGWNKGGQDRGNPLLDTDPRLGTKEELKAAIAQIQATGVQVILFNKYVWADATTDWYRSELHNYIATDPYGLPYIYKGWQYQTPEQLAGFNTRPLAVACMNVAKWRDVSAHEFQKILDLGATGMLFDESANRNDVRACFSPDHGHHVPSDLLIGDVLLARRFAKMTGGLAGGDNFMFAAEDPGDELTETYALSYFRISTGHVPAVRYADPLQQMMIAVTGFDDREMINRALMYRYVISYEPFHFKGNLDDFPLTVAYGKKVDSLRKQYNEYLWDAEFRDTCGASVTLRGAAKPAYSVFRGLASGKYAVVVVNDQPTKSIIASVRFEDPIQTGLISVSPEDPDGRRCSGEVNVPPRSAIIILQQ